MLTWLLGGHRLLTEFQNFAEIQYITGGLRRMFYQILELDSRSPDSVRIRDSIVKVSKYQMSIPTAWDANSFRTPSRSGTEFN